MKTIKQWLKDGLSKEDYKRAEKYENERWEEEKESFEGALMGAFIWGDTREGYNYWEEIHDNGASLQTTPTKECSDTNLTISPKFIKTIYKLSSPEVRQELEQEFSSLILELKEGQWYNYDGNLLCYKGEDKSYGFWDGVWGEDWYIENTNKLERLKKATEEEVRDALIEEAKKRGYKAGNFICLRSGALSTPQSVDDYDKWTLMVDKLYTKGLGLGGDAVYMDGKWAEVLSATFTLEEAREFIAKIRGVAKEEITIQS